MEMENCLILNVRIILHQKQFSHVFQTTHIWFITKCHCSSPFPPCLPPACTFPSYFLSLCLPLWIIVWINFLTSFHKISPVFQEPVLTTLVVLPRTLKLAEFTDQVTAIAFSTANVVHLLPKLKKKKVCEVSANNFCA